MQTRASHLPPRFFHWTSKMSRPRSKHRPRKVRLLRFLPNTWVRTAGPRRERTLYLSFDDGPSPTHTPRLLELLAQHGARATFFLIGSNIERHESLTRSIIDAGHAIANHSYSHPHFEQLSLPEQIAEVDRTNRLLSAIDGQPSHAFRPPRGVLSIPMVWHFIRTRRHIAYWSWDSLDYSERPAEELIKLALRNPPHPGDIILMHDDSGIAFHMLTELLPEWKTLGFSFEALPAEAS